MYKGLSAHLVGTAHKALRKWSFSLNESHTNEVTRCLKSDHAGI